MGRGVQLMCFGGHINNDKLTNRFTLYLQNSAFQRKGCDWDFKNGITNIYLHGNNL